MAVSPILLGIVGTLGGTILQSSSQKFKEQREIARQKAKERENDVAEDMERAKEIFEEVTRKTDSRLFVMECLYTAILQDNEDYKNEMKGRHKEIMWEWKSAETLTYTLIKSYFGEAVLSEYKAQIESVDSLYRDLRYMDAKPSEGGVPEDELEYVYESFWGGLANTRNYLRILNAGMMELIQSKKVGRFLPERAGAASK